MSGWRQIQRLGGPIGLALAALLVVILARQKQELQAQVDALNDRILWPHAGYVLPTVRAVSLTGDSVTVGEAPGETRQLLFVFNTRCGYCRESIPRWKELAGELLERSGDEVAVYGVSLDPEPETRAYAQEHGLTFPIVVFPRSKLRTLARFEAVPQTILAGPHGEVEFFARGSLERQPEVADSIRARVWSARLLTN